MRVGAAIAIATGMLGSACAREEGLLITVRADPALDAHHLELFLGGPPVDEIQGRRIRATHASDPLATEDLQSVDGSVDGYTIFLDGIDGDIRLATVAVFHDPPAEPDAYPVALGMAPVRLVKGELTTVDAFVGPTNDQLDRFALRWLLPAATDGAAAHSCLAWTDPGLPRFEAIIRDTDYDCDGTLPLLGCSDPLQIDPRVPDDLEERNSDGDPYTTCDQCPGPGGISVPCDCNDDPNTEGDDQFVGNPEVCDGIDNDCDASTHFATDSTNYVPCRRDLGGGECEVGVFGCVEAQPFNETDAGTCKQAITTTMVPCELNLSSCDTPSNCVVGTNGQGEAVSCNAELFDEPCNGRYPLTQLIDDLDPTPGFPQAPLDCTAVLWGADDLTSGWAARLYTPDSPLGARSVLERPCDQISIGLVSQGINGADPFSVIVIVIDKATNARYAIPVAFRSQLVAQCGDPAIHCTPPP